MMNNVLFILIFALYFISPCFAQDGPTSAEDLVAKMQVKLSLTQDQVAAVTPIIEKYSSKLKDLSQSNKDVNADRDSMRSQVKQLRDDEALELSQVLSDDQISAWKQMQRSMRKHSDGNSGNEARSGPTDGINGGDLQKPSGPGDSSPSAQ